MQAKNDPNAAYVDIETFTRHVREDKIRSGREYEVFYAAGMLDGTFPPDPVAFYAKRQLNAFERYLWWREVLGPRCIEKPPPGSTPIPEPPPPDHKFFRKTPQKQPKPEKEKVPAPKPVVAEKPPEPPAPDPVPAPDPKEGPKLVRRSTFKYVSFRDSGYDDD